MKKKVVISVFVIVIVCLFVIIFSIPKNETKESSDIQDRKEKVVEAITNEQPKPSVVLSPMDEVENKPLLTPTQSMNNKQYSAPPKMTIDTKKTYTAVLDTSKGAIKINLFASENPVTVNNFVFLAKEKFYDNTIFHRIIKGFMVQGGDPTGTGAGSPGYRFDDEKITRDYKKGTIAMANSGPNTNGSQFFIMHEDYPLQKNYVIFGTIDPSDSVSVKTLDAIANVPVGDSGRGEMSKPLETVTLKKVDIEEK